MKTNAIIRIVIWSIVIVILVGALSSVLFGRRLNSRYSEDSGFVRAPDSSAASKETSASITSGTQGSVDAAQVRRLSIEWVAGDITIQAKEGIDQIRFSEDTSDCSYPMVYRQTGEKLTIQFCKESFGFKNFGKDVRKDLVMEVPADWVCQELELDAAAADLTILEVMAKEVDFDGASGRCDFLDCTVGALDVDAASGEVTFSGSLETLDLDAASGSFTGVFTANPKRIDMDGMSGDLDITLPAGGGYTARIDGMSGSIHTEGHTATVQNGRHSYGDRSCIITLDGMSCDLTIHLEETP